MMEFTTIRESIEGVYKEKGSKFLAFGYPVQDIDQVKEKLESLRKKYHDARHHCYAYVIGMEDQLIRANDDGEPNHSAGDPILGQIRSFGLTNILVVVVRYFGGIKLGVGGLVNAYKQAAFDALSKSTSKIIYPTRSFSLIFPYEITSEVESILHEYEIEYTGKNFTAVCEYQGKLRSSSGDDFSQKITSIKGVSFRMC